VRTVLDDRQVQALLQGAPDSFLQSRADGAFQSDHIIGVMDGLRMGFAHDLAETEKTEADSVAAYDGLMTSKNKELVAARSTFRMLTEERTGLNAELARNRDDLAATQVSYAQDKAAYEQRKKECGSKTQEFHARQQARLEEMLAINEAVQVLSSDDTHVVLSKSMDKQPLPQPGGLVEVSETSQVLSFLQVSSQQTTQVSKGDPHDVLKYVQELAKANPQHALLAQLALKLEGMSAEGKFERVIQVIQQQITIIDMEQGEDDKKMTWCKDETARNKEAIELKTKEKADFEAQIGNTNADLTLLKDEASSIAKEMDEIRRQLDDAGRQRGDERSSFDTTMAELKTAQTALVKAIQVLEGFYGQQSLLQQQSAAANAMRQQTQVNQLVDQQASAGGYEGKPSTPDGEYKGAAGGRSILKLLGNLGQDLVHEEEARRAAEKEAQETYDQLVGQTQVNIKLKSDQLLQRREQMARLEQTRDQFQSDSDDALNLINELKKRELDLAKNCYILETYAKRKEMRGGERNAMEHAIQILS